MKIKQKLMSFKYWLHWALISIVTLGILQLLFKGDMFSIKNILLSTPLIAVGDIVSGLILKFFKMDVD